MKKTILMLAMAGINCYAYGQNIHESGTHVGVGTTSPIEQLTVANTSPNALGIYRDLDVASVGPAGVFFNLGARKRQV